MTIIFVNFYLTKVFIMLFKLYYFINQITFTLTLVLITVPSPSSVPRPVTLHCSTEHSQSELSWWLNGETIIPQKLFRSLAPGPKKETLLFNSGSQVIYLENVPIPILQRDPEQLY
uniref:Uncharacterized protein n=1 Tax=Lepeophtheirus salmonis TaxID=72036 RepID=A0A0K2U953_LEPSM